MKCEICNNELNFVGGNWFECEKCGSFVQVKKFFKDCEICGGELKSIGNNWYKCEECDTYVKEQKVAL